MWETFRLSRLSLLKEAEAGRRSCGQSYDYFHLNIENSKILFVFRPRRKIRRGRKLWFSSVYMKRPIKRQAEFVRYCARSVPVLRIRLSHRVRARAALPGSHAVHKCSPADSDSSFYMWVLG